MYKKMFIISLYIYEEGLRSVNWQHWWTGGAEKT